MVSTITRAEANEILSKGYPTDEELKKFPLSDLLLQIPDVDPRCGAQSDGKPGHLHRTIDGMNILLSDHPENICAKLADEKFLNFLNVFKNTYRKIFRDIDEKAFCRFDFNSIMKPFLRLLALYHDIGKSIITDRHSIIGWHLITDVHREEALYHLYPLILGINQADWESNLKKYNNDMDKFANPEERRLIKIFTTVIKYHEHFGILSTGEASLPVMLDLIDFSGVEIDDARELFSVLMIMNLADVYGTIEVLPQKVEIFCDDLGKLCYFISKKSVEGDRDKFYEALRVESQKPESTIDRLWRLMYEGAPSKWRAKIKKPIIEKIFNDVVYTRKKDFMRNFALFCKLDYCLSFKNHLMNTAILFTDKNINSSPNASIRNMINILSEMEKRYGDLCQRPDSTFRRIGFEMAGLTRKPATHKKKKQRQKSKIADKIVELLLRPDTLGNGWAISECTVWFLEE
jgi:hypothetical protein